VGSGGRMDLAWKAEGACRWVDPELFFPISDVDAEPAKRVCAACGVRDRCLEHALTTRESEGIWGGLTPGERRAIAASRPVLSA
jgi:WhiB family transcriptional regulator, redox-sensing transcriptional regulator